MEGSSDDCGLWALEPAVNQWVLEYFFHLYVDAFKNRRNEDFVQIRDIVSILMQRRLKSVEQNSQVLRIMQLLSCVEEGGDLDCRFDENENETPLETAVGILDSMKQEKTFPADLINTNQQMLKEAAVVACIQKQQFSRAKSVIRKHIANTRNTRLRADLMHIIQERNIKHPLIANFSLSTIKDKVYDMFESQIQNIPSFLLTLAQKEPADLKGKSKEHLASDKQPEQSLGNVLSSEEDSLTPDLKSQILVSQSSDITSSAKDIGSEVDCGPTFSLSAMRSKFLLLCQDDNPDVKFRHLCETDFCRENAHLRSVCNNTQNSKSHRACSPREEASVLDEKVQGKCLTLHQLVMDQDSQVESEEEEKQEESPKQPQQQKRSSATIRRLFNSPTTNKRRKTATNSRVSEKESVVEEQDTWSDEDDLFQRSSKSTNSTSSSGRRRWTIEETDWIKSGVEKYGEGKWAQILKNYPFHQRTAIMIKDRWRTMKKLCLV
ncbi:telomeric repeat-binding factor 2 isoform X2 [Bufo gargarizans]|uniref:telomeric repeat-binding factor 2 isoform X2 n=1 Tax=Bufo gargarizans TaxID=30331 RepID=UPI001CF13604|nr:telomeric repeat-binding factor 2 isoform X2 [Bufo gargarizans]